MWVQRLTPTQTIKGLSCFICRYLGLQVCFKVVGIALLAIVGWKVQRTREYNLEKCPEGPLWSCGPPPPHPTNPSCFWGTFSPGVPFGGQWMLLRERLWGPSPQHSPAHRTAQYSLLCDPVGLCSKVSRLQHICVCLTVWICSFHVSYS